MGATESLAEHVVTSDWESFSEEVLEVARRIVLDGASVAIAGVYEDAARLVARHVADMGGNPLSSVIGFGFKTSAPQAAYVNGVSMHVLDYEPMSHPPTHATSTTLPVALAMAEWLGLAGRDVMAAIIVGFEVQGRIGMAGAHLTPDSLTFHPPGTLGIMGAAATAAKILGLDVERTRHAFGIAASRAGALMANVGTMTKSNHCGNAARLGLEAALLARDGYTANPDVFEARFGYGQCICGGDFDAEALTKGFGRPYRMVEPGIAFKLFPSQYGTNYGISAALEVRKERAYEPRAIEHVDIISPCMGYVDRPFPRTGLEGKSSFQYTVAAALLDGEVNINTFSNERRFASDMEDMLRKTSLEQRSEIPGSLRDMYVTVRLSFKDGRVVERTCEKLQGSWGKPLSSEELLRKAEYCLTRKLSKQQAQRCISLGQCIDALPSEGVGEFIKILRG